MNADGEIMEELIEKIMSDNREFGIDTEPTPASETPAKILMIDQETTRKCSPQMVDLFSIIGSWSDGLKGQSIINPKDLAEVYADRDVSRAIELAAENYKPVPPSDSSDWSRTALFAKEENGLGLFLFWWENRDDDEPAIIEINGGTIVIYRDLVGCLREVAFNEVDPRGDDLYAQLEGERGTLGG